MKPCPLCGGSLEKHTGVIDEPVITGYGKLERRARPATFLACSSCEHCEEWDAKAEGGAR